MTVAQLSGASWPAIMPQRPCQHHIARPVELPSPKDKSARHGRFVDRRCGDFDRVFEAFGIDERDRASAGGHGS